MPKPPARLLVVACQKGGAGKTTLARNLAVAAGEAVALLDLDPQGSLTAWWNRRGRETPALATARPAELPELLARLGAAGVELVIADTPPAATAWLGEVLRLADLALVPARPSPDDLDAVGATLELLEDAGCPFVFVVAQAKPRTRLALEAVPALAQHGRVAPVVVHDRVAFAEAALAGLGVTEHDPDGQAAAEIGALLTYLRKHLRKKG
jgi:chromosome partitioning protein